MQVKPVNFKGLMLVLQRETVAPFRSMPSPNNDRGPAPAAPSDAAPSGPSAPLPAPAVPGSPPREIGGRAGPEPTRFGDWEKGGRCIDF